MRNKIYSLVLILFALQSVSVNAVITKKLLVIGTDGTRADAITPTLAPNITALLPTSTYSFTGLTTAPTMSCVGWNNMCTGVWPMKHNIMNSSNDFSPNNYAQWPDFFTYLERSNPLLNTASFCNWGPLNTYLFHTDYKVNTATYSDAVTTTNAINYITNSNPDALLVDLDEVDHAGHTASFDPANATYAAAVTTMDTQVKSLIDAVKARPNYANEDWLIIITTDHGGDGTNGHGNGTIAERRVWTVVNGGNATQGVNKDNTSTTTYNFANSVALSGGSYFKATNKTAFNFGTTQDFTVECKVKIASVTGDPAVLATQNWNSGGSKGFTLFVQGDKWYFNIADGSKRTKIVGGPIADNKWHTLSVSVDRDRTVALYQDGVFISSALVDNIGDINSGLEFAVGQDGTTTYGSKFGGSIADVRVWNQALSSKLIAGWYNQDIQNTHPAYSALIANWKLNEGSGTSGADLKGTNPLIGSTSPAVTWTGATNSTTPTFENAMKMVDIAVTAMDHFGVHPLNLDGKSLLPSTVLTTPTANFTSDITSVTKGNSVLFTNGSTSDATNIEWTFPGGYPSTSIDQNPVVRYNTPGTYAVTLTASNPNGVGEKTTTDYITVVDATSANALNFTGGNSTVHVNQTPAFNFGTGINFTIEAWIAPETQGSDPAVLGNKDWGSGGNVGYCIYQKAGKLLFNISDGTTRVNGYNDISFGTIPVGVWSHIAVVVQRGGNITTYLNGVQQNQVSCATMLNSISTTLGFSLGNDGTGTYGPSWNGKLDEVRIWNAARTPQQIYDNIMSELPNPQSEAFLVGYYKFNAATGKSLADQKSIYHGTLSSNMTNANWIATGAFRDVLAPAAPASLSNSNLTSTSLTLNWPAATDNVGVTGYKVYNGSTFLTTTTNLSYNVAGLSPNTAYTFNVSAIDAQANESAKATLGVSTTITAAKTVENGLVAKVYTANHTLFIENVSGKESNVEICNELGQKIESAVLKVGINSFKVKTAGVYVIKTQNGNSSDLKKVIVE